MSLFASLMLPITIIKSQISVENVFYIVCLSILLFTLSLIIRVTYFNKKNPSLELRFHLWDPIWYIPTGIISIILGAITVLFFIGNNYLLTSINDFYNQTVGNTQSDNEWSGFITLFVFLPISLVPYYLSKRLVDSQTKIIKLIGVFLVILYTGLLFYVFFYQQVAFNNLALNLQYYDSIITKFLAGSVYITWLFLILKELPCRDVKV